MHASSAGAERFPQPKWPATNVKLVCVGSFVPKGVKAVPESIIKPETMGSCGYAKL
jgi:hypothetical protein